MISAAVVWVSSQSYAIIDLLLFILSELKNETIITGP
jgi:hypothetical protein